MTNFKISSKSRDTHAIKPLFEKIHYQKAQEKQIPALQSAHNRPVILNSSHVSGNT